MSTVCFYFQVHQPYRVRPFSVFDAGTHDEPDYFGDTSDTNLNNARVLRKVARKSYLPANQTFLELLEAHPELRLSFSFSGIVLEQLRDFAPEVLASFQALVATGQVEVLAETYYHSLAFFYDKQEFAHQVARHERLVNDIFGTTPRVFRNTELSYNDELGQWADSRGYAGILAEGWDPVLGWRSPNFVYRPAGTKKARLLLKNYKLSDDMAFRFSEQEWEGWPLTAEKFAGWISDHNALKDESGEVINLFIDYETFGEHQWEDTGIFDFLKRLPGEILAHPDNSFMTPSEVIAHHEPRDEVHVPHTTTWADTERDLSAWLGNDMQNNAIEALYDLKTSVIESDNPELIEDWRRLQTSDHFYYMCTKWFNDGDVHAYFNPYDSPYDAFVAYMNVLTDLRLRTQDRTGPRINKNPESRKLHVK